MTMYIDLNQLDETDLEWLRLADNPLKECDLKPLSNDTCKLNCINVWDTSDAGKQQCEKFKKNYKNSSQY